MVKKQFLKTKCQVDFELPAEISDTVESVSLVGDFNDWDAQATPMLQSKAHLFTVRLNLQPDREYQYRYLINGQDWHNDWNADRYVSNPFSGDNSVVSTYQANKPKFVPEHLQSE
jgi:1,4-alpha-glucan branching enzyme